MEARYLRENLKIQWVSEAGLIENISFIVSEFKIKRQLLPLQICILGPPASGKTTIADRLANYYKIHHITIADVISEQIQLLEKLVSRER